jgi:sulfatase maturation enzyme AslB (radical SAM superfamily)
MFYDGAMFNPRRIVMSEDVFDSFDGAQAGAESMEIDVSSLSSVTLARLVDEVRNEEAMAAHSYDRSHNRHNR